MLFDETEIEEETSKESLGRSFVRSYLASQRQETDYENKDYEPDLSYNVVPEAS